MKAGKSDFIDINIFYDATRSMHSHRDVELIYVLRGAINLTIEDKYYSMGQDDIVLINSGKRHAILKKPTEKSLVAAIKISQPGGI